MNDWRQSQLQRDVAAMRKQLEPLDAQIADLTAALEEARGFAGEYGAALADIERRMAPVVPGITLDMYRVKRTDAELAEYQRLRDERSALERERDQAIARSVVGGVPRLSVAAVERRLHYLRTVRSVAASELRDLEDGLTPGERVQTGAVAPEYAEHRERVAKLRQQVGAA